MSEIGVTLCAIFRVPADGIAAFQAYEDAVLPLLASHGATLQRRLRAGAGEAEIHLIWFPSGAHLTSFRADPRRSAQTALLDSSGADVEVLTVADVGPNDPY